MKMLVSQVVNGMQLFQRNSCINSITILKICGYKIFYNHDEKKRQKKVNSRILYCQRVEFLKAFWNLFYWSVYSTISYVISIIKARGCHWLTCELGIPLFIFKGFKFRFESRVRKQIIASRENQNICREIKLLYWLFKERIM